MEINILIGSFAFAFVAIMICVFLIKVFYPLDPKTHKRAVRIPFSEK